ncbi:MAG: PKD domain-containing protein [Myxococcota bacterium]|nr:PKD domain-containing protein [Myxococcota bacterium]
MKLIGMIVLLAGCSQPTDEARSSLTDSGAAAGPHTDDTTESSDCSELTATIHASRLGGALPLLVDFDGSDSCGPAPINTYTWSFEGEPVDGIVASHTWLSSGDTVVTLTVTDADGSTAASTLTITAEPASCPEIDAVLEAGALEHDELDESSGLMVSRLIPDLMWTHNDSGDAARVFAVGLDGRDRGVFTLSGAEAGDWEDSAIYTNPSSGQTTLFIGDIGDNSQERESISVFMVPEPDAALLDATSDTVLSDWSVLTLTYPDGVALNADTLLVDPQTGDLYIVADRGDAPVLYRKPAPHTPDGTAMLEEVVALNMGYPTGGGFSPLGDKLLLRTADEGLLWLRDSTFDLVDALQSSACSVPIAEEARGEAVDFLADGSGYVTTSEEAYEPVWVTELHEDTPCIGLEARLLTSADLEVPAEVRFSVDPYCVPEGIASVVWNIAGEESTTLAPTFLFESAGSVPVSFTVTDAAGTQATTQAAITLTAQSCPETGETETLGSLESASITETSGVVVSALSDGVLWVHNDSGDSARLFAIAESGALLGTYTLDVSTRDWEDLTVGWNAELGTEALYIGDVGDNATSRESLSVVIVPEPVVELNQAEISAELTDFSTLTLTYPDGEAHNCETLAYDPRTGSLIIVTKSADGESHVFEKSAPHEDGTETELTFLTTLQFGSEPLTGSANTTAGDFSPLGDQLLIRTYSDAWMWLRDGSESLADALAGEACDADAPSEDQGEAIAYTPDGSGYITISEGTGSPILLTPLQ